jgi:hypothetical protein
MLQSLPTPMTLDQMAAADVDIVSYYADRARTCYAHARNARMMYAAPSMAAYWLEKGAEHRERAFDFADVPATVSK